MRGVFDTNILIDYLGGNEAARDELGLYDAPMISLITWMEVLVGARSDEEARRLRAFLAGFERIPVNEEVSERAVLIRRTRRIRLPDAIIWASAQSRSVLLVTRNTRDFPRDAPGIRVPYEA